MAEHGDPLALTPAERQRLLSLLLDNQPPGTWQLKAVTRDTDTDALLVVERARVYIPWPVDVGRATNLADGGIHTATIKPSELPDEKDHWRQFHLST